MGTASPASLVSAHAKLGRAKAHADCLRADILEKAGGQLYAIPLQEQLDTESGVVRFVIESLPDHPTYWGLMIGDALHNYRSALDNGWWQLACHHLKRVPTEQEAKQIQFPILKKGGVWDAGRAQWVGNDAAAFAKALQPDPRGYAPDTSHPLADLNRLSNEDKHRGLHPTFSLNGGLVIDFKALEGFVEAEGTDRTIQPTHFAGRAPAPGDTVLTVPASSYFFQPDVELDVKQTAFISLQRGGSGQTSILTQLAAIHEWVENTLGGFERILAGERVEIPEFVLGPKRI